MEHSLIARVYKRLEGDGESLSLLETIGKKIDRKDHLVLAKVNIGS